MIKKIKNLTPKQEAKIPEYIEKWTKLASEPIDFAKTEKILSDLYKEKEDPIVVYCESLDELRGFISVLTKGKNLKFNDRLHDRLNNRLHDQLDSRLYNQLDNRLDIRLYSQLDGCLRNRPHNRLRDRLYVRLHNRLHDRLHDRLDNRLYNQLDNRLYNQFDNRLHDRLHARLDEILKNKEISEISWSKYISYYLYDWAGYYDFAQYIGVDFNKKELQEYNDILLNLPITVFLGDGLIFVVEKPRVVFSNERLHSETEPAISWKDGSGMYFLEDVEFDKELWEGIIDRTIDPIKLIKLENQEQKITGLKYYGWKNLLNKLKPKVLDTKTLFISGKNLHHQVLQIEQDGWTGRFLKFTDPADNDEGLLRVDHTDDTTKTVEGARKYGFRPLMEVLGDKDVEFAEET